MNEKQKIRERFRREVLERDHYRCRVCGEAGTDETLDPHHITDRNLMPNGGYVKENGITLCKKCHVKAEDDFPEPKYLPEALYKLIGSSEEKAYQASIDLALLKAARMA